MGVRMTAEERGSLYMVIGLLAQALGDNDYTAVKLAQEQLNAVFVPVENEDAQELTTRF